MATDPAAFADEFGKALVKYGSGGSGQWFGRLVAFEFEVINFRGNNFSEDEFRKKMDDKEIVINSFQIEGRLTVSGNTVTGIAMMDGSIDGGAFQERIQFTHNLQPALQSTQTTFSPAPSNNLTEASPETKNLPANVEVSDMTADFSAETAAAADGSSVEIPMHAFTKTSPTHEWDDPKYSWFIWQYIRSLEIYSNGQWFGRLTDGGYTVDILGQNVTKAAIVQSFSSGAAAILFAVDTETVKYTDHGNGTATAVCQAKIGGNIGGVNIPEANYTMTHQIRSTPSAKTPWIADSSTISA